MGNGNANDPGKLVDLVSWAIGDAIIRNQGPGADLNTTLGTLGYANSAAVSTILDHASQELEKPANFPRPANLLQGAYIINQATMTDPFYTTLIADLIDPVARALVNGGYVVPVAGA
ncbi:MAG: hypothetical protein ABSC95_13830 [Acetobacteraceae bacterium]|jgi:hypothetical protein